MTQTPNFKDFQKCYSMSTKKFSQEEEDEKNKENIYILSSKKLFAETNFSKQKNYTNDETDEKSIGMTKRLNEIIHFKSKDNKDNKDYSKISCSTNLGTNLNLNFCSPEVKKIPEDRKSVV